MNLRGMAPPSASLALAGHITGLSFCTAEIDIFADFDRVSATMLMMRLQRVGRKNDPSYRIVVTDKRTSPKSNKHVDLLGSFNPKAGVATIDAEKAKYWLSQGVQPSVTLHNMLVSQKIVEGKKLNALSRKSPIVDEEALKKAAEEKAAAEKAAAEAEAAKAAAAASEVETPAEATEEPKEEATA